MGINLLTVKKVFFVGVGGIGISAIARMMLVEGKEVWGSDFVRSQVTDDLEDMGMHFGVGQALELIPENVDLIVYTKAIEVADPEFFKKLKEGNIPVLSYPEMLALVSKEKYTIAVAGTHGKTTTTAMIGTILIDAGIDPTIVVGAQMKREKSNLVVGKGEYFVVEADEYRRSFLNLSPKILVITSIDEDHLDYYKDLSDIQSAFKELAQKVPEDGFIICNRKDEHVSPAIHGARAHIVDYTKEDSELKLKFPGKHNVANARAAASAARCLGIEKTVAQKSLQNFEGTERRFELKGETANGVLVYDDYAHNPQKIRAALEGAREMYPNRKIIAVFQPHLFSRTKLLLKEFAISFKDADQVTVLPIYPAREKNDGTIKSEDLVEAIRPNNGNVSFFDFDSASEYLREKARAGDVVITLGAGEAYRVGDDLLK